MVFVLDTNKCPLAPCHEAVARKLLKQGKAAIYKRFPFTIILKKSVDESEIKPTYRDWETDRKSTRLNSSHRSLSRMPSSA